MPASSDDPPPAVLENYGIVGPSTPLQGGDEASFVIDGVVLKKVMDPTLAEWTQALLSGISSGISSGGIRVPEPLRSATGQWSIEGWTATAFVPGLRSGIGRWREITVAGRDFNAALVVAAEASGIPDPAPVLARTDRWAVADRFVWGEIGLALSAEAGHLVDRLRERQGSDAAPTQIIHGDLTGNVFFDRDDVPTVIDFSPLVRPASHSLAIVAGDALLWHDAGIDVVDEMAPGRDWIARALMFRLVAEQLADDPRHGARLDDYRRVLDLLEW